MPAYNLDTAEAFARHARRALEEDEDASLPTLQVALYNARVSLEMTLKALLEKAGMPVGSIRARNHHLRSLLNDLGTCQVKLQIGEQVRLVAATGARALEMSFHGAVLTVGWVIDAEDHEASRFPNGIRYAQPSEIKDYPPAAVVAAAYRLLEWAREHWDDITWSPTQ